MMFFVGTKKYNMMLNRKSMIKERRKGRQQVGKKESQPKSDAQARIVEVAENASTLMFDSTGSTLLSIVPEHAWKHGNMETQKLIPSGTWKPELRN